MESRATGTPELLRLPLWTEKQESEGQGRDPLGVAVVSGRIVEAMLPGLTTQTPRARYYSFYPWAVREARAEMGSGSRARYVAAFQRRDAAYLLACYSHHPKEDYDALGQLVGRRQAARKWPTESGAAVELGFKPLPSEALGGFGQYYGGALGNLGVVARDERGDLLTPLGEELAAHFAAAVSRTRYGKEGLADEKVLELDVLRDLGGRTCLCSLAQARAERDLIRNLLFVRVGDAAAQPHAQRQTLTLLLDLLDFAARQGRALPADSGATYWLLERILYYTHGERPEEYVVPTQLVEAAETWRGFQLHAFFGRLLEHVGKAVTDFLRAAPDGLELADIAKRLVKQTEFRKATQGAATVKDLVGTVWSGALDEGGGTAFSREHPPTEVRSETSLLDLLHEADGTQETVEPSFRLATALLGLAALSVRSLRFRVAERKLMFAARGDLWLGVVRPRFLGAESGSVGIEEFVYRLIDEFIVEQHKRTLFGRHRLEGRRIEERGARLVYEGPIDPAPPASRFESACRLLQDLGLIETRGSGAKAVLRLASDGEDLRRELLRLGDAI